jgi:alpha-glucuronidase
MATPAKVAGLSCSLNEAKYETFAGTRIWVFLVHDSMSSWKTIVRYMTPMLMGNSGPLSHTLHYSPMNHSQPYSPWIIIILL